MEEKKRIALAPDSYQPPPLPDIVDFTLPDDETLQFKWDGSHLGPLDLSIEKHYEFIQDDVIRRILVLNPAAGGGLVHLNRFDGNIPLIADELKPLFGLPKIGRHRCTVANARGVPREALISRIDGEEMPFKAELASDARLVACVQRCYLFRWALGLTRNSDSALWMRTYKSGVTCVTSYRETKVDYEKTKCQGAVIPDSVMKRWFGDWDKVDQTARQVFGETTAAILKFNIEDIIRRYDTTYVWWAGAIVNRIFQRL